VTSTFRKQASRHCSPEKLFLTARLSSELSTGIRTGSAARYIIMEKVRNGGKDYPASVRNGDWEFASFTPARALITNDPVTRCLACHKSQAQSDYLFGLNEMKSYKLK